LVGNLEGKRPLGIHGRRWACNIRMDLQKIKGEAVDWIDLVQDRGKWGAVVVTVMDIRVPEHAGNFWTS
jgi:hypothetical protein